ncbi:hypothetical protein [Ruminococcus sp.]|uniref:hypothetical protein n=1 Tax=Ruminococcus sp. TaxID=41978 RepID=UPI0025F1B593|nr:hypothetical protein [Ruminococcus sp.]MBR1433313.1 hypothetical protein [Ruminococcus sp.]
MQIKIKEKEREENTMTREQKTDALRASIAKAQKKQRELSAEVDKTEAKLAKLEKELHAELDKQKTQNCRKMGELIYEKFGDDITPSEFEEMISFIFMNDEIREYIESEKKKRKAAEAAIVNDTEICDSAPDKLSQKNEKS